MERKNNVVGVLKLRELQICIQALEKFEKEVQAVVDGTPDSQLDDEWLRQKGITIDASGALGTFRLIVKNAEKINNNPNTAFTIQWQGGLGKALEKLGLDMKPEAHEKEQQGEWDD